MKRPLAPSHAKPTVKKAKKTDMRDVPKDSVAAQPLTARQLKSFQFLISAASYSAIDADSFETPELKRRLYGYYHGNDEDTTGGLVGDFLAGYGAFSVLWDSGRIAAGYGHLSGLSHERIKEVIHRSKVGGDKLLSGRKILENADDTLYYAKMFMEHWVDFLVDGEMPRGKDEDDALQYVVKTCRELGLKGSYSVTSMHAKHKIFLVNFMICSNIFLLINNPSVHIMYLVK